MNSKPGIKGDGAQRPSAGSSGVLRLPPYAFYFLVLNLAGLLLVAVWFRCRALGNIPGLSGDEAWYGVQAWDLLHHGTWPLLTPTGNLLNPFFFGPLLLLQACLPPSIVALRAVAVASGLLALVVNWLLCRWVFDRRTAILSTVALAVLPINIVYSRLAWDAAQSLVATLPVLYFSLAAVRFPARQDRYTAIAVLALLAAIWVHPTNIFCGAAIVVALAVRWRQFRLNWRTVAIFIVAVLTLTIWAKFMIKMPGVTAAGGRLENLRELVNPTRWPHLMALYAGLFSGETVYQYIASHSWLQSPAIGIAATGLLGVALPWGLLLAAAGTLLWNRSDRNLVAMWALQLAGFLVLAGSHGMIPSQERLPSV